MGNEIRLSDQLPLYIIAIFVPPIAVVLKLKKLTIDLPINIVLWFIGIIPGIIHAWWVIYHY